MNNNDLIMKSANLSSILKCLATVDQDEPEVTEVLPQALNVVQAYAQRLYEDILVKEYEPKE